MHLSFQLIIVVSIICIFTNNADAYIDPNTGGFFFQSVAPFVYGLLGVVVVFWNRIKGYVKGLFGRNKNLSDSSKDE